MQEDEKTLEELVSLAKDLYSEGYHCGINDDTWFKAWASAMLAVARGGKYTGSLILDSFEKHLKP